jgi:hypothetical protein
MAMTVLTRQQCWIAPAMTSQAKIALRRMGFASLYPSYKSGTLEEQANPQIQIVRLLSCSTHFRLNPDIAPRPLRVARAERFRYAALVQQPSP